MTPYNQIRPTDPSVSIFKNAASGALVGAAFAGFCLLVGLGRIVFVLLSGRTMEAVSWDDARLLAFYVGGFVLAGAVVGVLRPLLRSGAAMFGAMALGGAIVTNTIAIAEKGLYSMSRVDWIAMTIMGALFGCAAAYGFVRAK